VRQAGLDGLVTVLLSDYRDLEGSYSKLVSIEMIEAVGWQYFDCGHIPTWDSPDQVAQTILSTTRAAAGCMV